MLCNLLKAGLPSLRESRQGGALPDWIRNIPEAFKATSRNSTNRTSPGSYDNCGVMQIEAPCVVTMGMGSTERHQRPLEHPQKSGAGHRVQRPSEEQQRNISQSWALLLLPWIPSAAVWFATVGPALLIISDPGCEEIKCGLKSVSAHWAVCGQLSFFFFSMTRLNRSTRGSVGHMSGFSTAACCCTGLHICFPHGRDRILQL